ncbi:MAG: DinB family protein [Chloroflexi bacterium]|nr:DinB family protein [Chloroflexota bacterium]
MIPDEIRDRVTQYIKHHARKPSPALLEHVSAQQRRLSEAFASVTAQEAVMAVPGDDWRIIDLLRHVVSAERSVAGLVQHRARGARSPRGGGIGQMMPEGEDYGVLRGRLLAVNEEVLLALTELPAAPDLTATAPHPFFGPLNCLEWASFQRVHDSDHIQHLEKMILALRGA